MEKRKQKQYEKERDEIVEKYLKLVHHHMSSLYIRFMNDVWKLNSKYFELKELEQKEIRNEK